MIYFDYNVNGLGRDKLPIPSNSNTLDRLKNEAN